MSIFSSFAFIFSSFAFLCGLFASIFGHFVNHSDCFAFIFSHCASPCSFASLHGQYCLFLSLFVYDYGFFWPIFNYIASLCGHFVSL